MLPEFLKITLEEQLNETVDSVQRVSGGSINQAAKIFLSKTGTCFLKWNTTANPDMFKKEVLGLRLLASTGTAILIPDIILQGIAERNTGFLLMEFIEEGPPETGAPARFGHALAELHKEQAGQFGLDHDNYIGRLPQSNTWHTDWVSFFVEERLEPQLALALDAGKFRPGIGSLFQAMYKCLPDVFPDEPPGLLHGDLWGGNYFYDSTGKAVMYDPAVYFGHREIELAFTHLFGGFSARFYQAYQETCPLEAGFPDRRDLYNLYPLLVHTNLFGGSYARQVESIIARFK